MGAHLSGEAKFHFGSLSEKCQLDFLEAADVIVHELLASRFSLLTMTALESTNHFSVVDGMVGVEALQPTIHQPRNKSTDHWK